MELFVKALMTGVATAVLLLSTAAQAQLKPEEMVETRQAGYQFMSWNMGKIKAQVVDGEEPTTRPRSPPPPTPSPPSPTPAWAASTARTPPPHSWATRPV